LNFDDTPEEAAVREEIRTWLQANAPIKGSTDFSQRSELERLELAKAFQAKLFDAGWAGLAWPEEHGGRGATAIEQMIFEQELAGFDAPWGVFFVIGIGMAGPTIIAHGTAAQKERFLRPTLRGDLIWCQLFSEPAAGSDLAGLRTSAVRDGDEFVLNGQKIWTSGGHYSDWGILVARTDFEAPKHRGLTYFLCDMSLPGIELRPIKQINGDAHFNETFFDDVRIPADMVLGEVGGGWGVAMTTLSNERTAIGGGGASRSSFAELHDLARRMGRCSDAVVRQELAGAFTRHQVSRFLGYRIQTALSRGEAPGPESSILKLFHGLDLARTTNFALELLGPAGSLSVSDDESWFHEWATAPSMRIAGGTDEIQRNVLAERVLGLPSEPRADKGVPFNTVPVGI
jgi:alkylation response protein AidB-like acyl-CoA dehydrogenase